IGYVYLPRAGAKLPDEPRRLAVVMTGPRDPEFWGVGVSGERSLLDFYDLKGIVETLVSDLHLTGVSFRPSSAVHLHPGRAAELLIGAQAAGCFGELPPRVASSYNLGEQHVLVGEFDLEVLLAAVPERYTYSAVPRFPPALRDIAVIVDEAVPGERLE